MTQIFSAVKAVIVKEGKILFIKQTVKGKEFWDFPGGRLKFGENPFETLKREVKEETNLDIEILKPVGLWWYFRERDGNQVICNTFLCRAEGQVSKNVDEEDEEIKEFKWMTKEEFLKGKHTVSHESFNQLIFNL